MKPPAEREEALVLRAVGAFTCNARLLRGQINDSNNMEEEEREKNLPRRRDMSMSNFTNDHLRQNLSHTREINTDFKRQN